MTGIFRDLFGPGTWGAGGNLVAWVICGALAGGWAWLFRRRLHAWWERVHPHREDLAEIRKAAEAAHRIAAATHERLTGERHPDAPETKAPGRDQP